MKNLEPCDCHGGIDCLGETREQDPTVARAITEGLSFLIWALNWDGKRPFGSFSPFSRFH